MPTAEIEIEIYCATCGDGLCNQSEFTTTRYRGTPSFRVAVCQACLKKERDLALEEGYAKGFAEAKEEFNKE